MIEVLTVAVLAFILWQMLNTPPALVLAGGWSMPAPPRQEVKEWEKNLQFKKGGGSAPSPDPAIGEAALANVELGKDWLDFAQEQFAKDNYRQEGIDDLTRRIGEQQLSTQDQANKWAKDDRARYEKTYQPLEDKFIKTTDEWGSQANQDKEAAAARADVLKSSDMAKAMARRDMARMGIDPRSGRYAGIDAAQNTQTALAAAGAENMARGRVKREGVAMSADAINMGRGLPSQAAGAAGLGLSAGNSVMQNNIAAAANARANTQTMGQGYQGAIGANVSGAGILNNQYGSQMQGWMAEQQAAGATMGAIGSLVGSGVGAYAALSSKKHKENNQPVDGALEAVNGLPVEAWNYKDGTKHPVTGELLPSDETHVGTYAEDFTKKTGLGDGKTLDLISANGLTMKAIQELDDKVDALAATMKKPAKKSAEARA